MNLQYQKVPSPNGCESRPYRSMRIPQCCTEATWSLGVSSYGRPQITTQEEDSMTSGPVMDFLTSRLKGPR